MLININDAPLHTLMSLPEIGRGIANNIISYREKYGRFAHISHIKKVTGIGDIRYRAIQSFISVGQIWQRVTPIPTQAQQVQPPGANDTSLDDSI
jgi:competence ComEA-like helix-hairpin-helix protein